MHRHSWINRTGRDRRIHRYHRARTDPGYAGIASADTLKDRTSLAVVDHERAGGFDGADLMVAGSTGTGWLDGSGRDGYAFGLSLGSYAARAPSAGSRGCGPWKKTMSSHFMAARKGWRRRSRPH